MGKKQKRRIARLEQRTAAAIAGRRHGETLIFNAGLEVGQLVKRNHQLKQENDQLRYDPNTAPMIVNFNAFRRGLLNLPTCRHPQNEIYRVPMAGGSEGLACKQWPPSRTTDRAEHAMPFYAQRVAVSVGRRKLDYHGWRIPAGVIVIDFDPRES